MLFSHTPARRLQSDRLGRMPTRRRETNIIHLVKQLDQLDSKRRTLVGQIQEAVNALGSGATGASPRGGWASSGSVPGRKVYKMSAAARRKMSIAAKKREALKRAAVPGGGGMPTPSRTKDKRTMSAAARKKISLEMKKRHAETKKAAAKSSLTK